VTAARAKSSHKPGPRGASAHARSRARAFAVQGLYQVLVGKGDIDAIDTFTRDLAGFGKCDVEHYARLLHGCATQRETLDATLQPALDRPLSELSPIEHGVLWIGVLELQQCPDVPRRVVLN
jgi:N utilization substance protein B